MSAATTTARVAPPATGLDPNASLASCNGCNLCVRECSFLQRTGNPSEIACGSCSADPFECTLCGLCTAVCPRGADPARYFLLRRRELRRERQKDDKRHGPLISYERKGTSRLFSFYGLPKGCDTVFFPGCALPGSRPATVSDVYQRLKELVPTVGIVLDCCLKPSHDLGREEHFDAVFGEMRDYLVGQGVRRVLVACPNCQRIFEQYGHGLAVQTVYELLLEKLPVPAPRGTQVVVHDPCVSRFLPKAQNAARILASGCGAEVLEMERSRKRTICCGRGGGVNFIVPGVLEEAASSRTAEADGRPIVTYCAACAGSFSGKATAIHLLDLWRAPEEALAGKAKVSQAPMTYLNRLRLKKSFKNMGGFAVIRERNTEGSGRKVTAVAAHALASLLATSLRPLPLPVPEGRGEG